MEEDNVIGSVSEIACIVGSSVKLEDDVFCTDVSIDSRNVVPGSLFVTLPGNNTHGNKFVCEAMSKGAVAVLSAKQFDFANSIVVDDPLKSMGKLARHYRKNFNCKSLAITGSCGKTSVKTISYSIFSLVGNTLSNERSFNSSIGLPLTLFKLKKEHDYGIFEIGTDHVGGIRYLSGILNPYDAAVITNIAPAHLEAFGCLENIAKEKFEIVEGLSKSGYLILPFNERKQFWKNYVGHSVLSFGLNSRADFSAENIVIDSVGKVFFKLCTPVGDRNVKFNYLGKHNVFNAMASAALAFSFGIDLDIIIQGLESSVPLRGRLSSGKAINGAIIINDSYNSNFIAAKAAIDLLSNYKREKILVLGDMLECGDMKDFFHTKIGTYAKSHNIDRLFTYGELSRLTSKAFGKGSVHFESKNDLILKLKQEIKSDSVVLLKASNSIGFQQVFDELEYI